MEMRENSEIRSNVRCGQEQEESECGAHPARPLSHLTSGSRAVFLKSCKVEDITCNNLAVRII